MERRSCRITKQEFAISKLEMEAFAHFGLPLPDFSPPERFRRYAAFHPEKHFYLRNCSATGAKLFSVFPPSTSFPVVALDFWRSSDWDASAFGLEFDFKRLFAEQLTELWRKVPRPAVQFSDAARSRIVSNVHQASDSFLVFDSVEIQQCLYSTELVGCRSCIDCHSLDRCERCYETIRCSSCFDLRFSELCLDCRDSWFLFNCQGCRDCFGCVNLVGKQYYLFNEPLTKEQYEAELSAMDLAARSLLEGARNHFHELLQQQPLPHLFSDDPSSTSGNYLTRTTNAALCFECVDCDDIACCHNIYSGEQLLDCVNGFDLRNSVQSIACMGGRSLQNCISCGPEVSDLAYCVACEHSHNLFGCIAMRNAEYCIFNTQYSKSEYRRLRAQIEKHLRERSVWGSFFPASLSPFPYNRSAANEMMPMARVPAQLMGYPWDTSDTGILPSELLGRLDVAPEHLYAELPERTAGLTPERVSELVFICELTGRPYQIAPDELTLLNSLGVPPPNRCFHQRHLDRIGRMAPHRLVDRVCADSNAPLETAFGERYKQQVLSRPLWAQRVAWGGA